MRADNTVPNYVKHIVSIGIIPESQCGFYPGRGTTEMTFALRLLQEKCKSSTHDSACPPFFYGGTPSCNSAYIPGKEFCVFAVFNCFLGPLIKKNCQNQIYGFTYFFLYFPKLVYLN
jgi:hypothetical protein